MPDLRDQFRRCFEGRVCLVGLGNVEYGDDGFGVHLARRLCQAGVPDVIVAESEPERCLGRIMEQGFNDLVFLDAVEFGGEPGAVVFLDATQIISRFPQFSTHKLSLGTLAQCFGAGGTSRVWLLGVQPQSLKFAAGLTSVLQTTLDALYQLLRSLKLAPQLEPAQTLRPAAEVNV